MGEKKRDKVNVINGIQVRQVCNMLKKIVQNIHLFVSKLLFANYWEEQTVPIKSLRALLKLHFMIIYNQVYHYNSILFY